MRGFSKAIIAGNLSRDPELRATSSGAQACGFTVAVNRAFKASSGEMQESVSFIDCTAWGKVGETINQYMRKGSAILVSGRLEQRSWDDKTTGQKRSRVEIVVEDFNFIGNSANAGESAGDTGYSASSAKSNNSSAKASAEEEEVPDDIPGDDISLDEIPF